MAPYDSDSGVDDMKDENDSGVDEDRTTLRKGRQPLGVTRQYVPSWKPGHAIREFYQNWKDAICETSHLNLKDLRPIVKGFDAKDVYTVEARHPVTRELLGFIRFKNGTLEFTNFKAQLGRRALDIGESTKRQNNESAGAHGEGFKVAAMVMSRRDYRVRYEASKFYWTMKFGGRDKSMLYCFLNDVSEKKLAKQIKLYNAKRTKGVPRELTNNVWEDVSVKIGKVLGQGKEIEKADFLKWTEVSLDLNRPSRVIDTPHGTLILDGEFRGKIYLKGLLLEEVGGVKPFQFGYNFFSGAVNRDRERLTNPDEEAKVLAHIWAAAIESNEHDTLSEYVSMIREDKVADVNIASKYMSEATAKKIWQELVRLDSENKFFYHEDHSGDKDVDIIRRSLKKEPVGLKGSIWAPLRHYNLVRTPQEQQCHLLHSAKTVEHTQTTYATSVRRAIRAALALDPRSRDLSILFKRAEKSDLDLLITDRDLEINDKWLDFRQSHPAETLCYFGTQLSLEDSGMDYFQCDHIINDLYTQILEEVKRQPGLVNMGNIASDSYLSLRVSESLRHMPIEVKLNQTSQVGEIEVTWKDLDRDVGLGNHGFDPKCNIILHRESTCSARRDEVVWVELLSLHVSSDGETFSQPSEASCGCHLTVVSRKDFKVVFSNLENQVRYFATVSRTEYQAFLGVSSNTASPLDANPKVPEQPSSSSSPATSQPETQKKPPSTTQPASSSHVSDLQDFDYGGLDQSDDDSPGGTSTTPTTSIRSAKTSQSVNKSNPRSIKDQLMYEKHPFYQKADQLRAVDEDKPSQPTKGKPQSTQETPGNTKAELDSVKEKLEQATSQIQAQDTQLKDKERLFSEVQAEILRVKGLLGERERKLSKMQASLTGVEYSHEETKQQLSTAQSEITEARSQLEKTKRQLNEAQVKGDNLEGQLKEKEQQLSDAQAEKTQAVSEVRVKQSEVEKLQQADNNAKLVIDNLRQKVQELKDEIEDLESKLEAAEENIDRQQRLTQEIAARRRGKAKRSHEDGEEDVKVKVEPSTKKQKTVSTTAQEGVVDLTSDWEDYPSA